MTKRPSQARWISVLCHARSVSHMLHSLRTMVSRGPRHTAERLFPVMAIEIPHFKFAYMALPKAGCSTIKRSLATVDPEFAQKAAEFPEFAADEDRDALVHNVYKTRRFWPATWAKYDHGWWRFCIVRDPVDRLLSCYADLVVKRRDLYKSRRLRRGLIDLPCDPDPDYFFQNIMAYSKAASTIRHHSASARWFLGPGLQDFDDIYPIERMSDCIEAISSRSGVPLQYRHENKSGRGLELADLKPSTRKVLRKFLANDYAVLSRWYDSPF